MSCCYLQRDGFWYCILGKFVPHGQPSSPQLVGTVEGSVTVLGILESDELGGTAKISRTLEATSHRVRTTKLVSDFAYSPFEYDVINATSVAGVFELLPYSSGNLSCLEVGLFSLAFDENLNQIRRLIGSRRNFWGSVTFELETEG